MAGNDEYTKLLLHMDDVGLTDSSDSNHTINLVGDVSRSDVQSKFGGFSALFDGDGDYIYADNHADFNFGAGNFTIDGWIYLTEIDKFNPIILQADDADDGWIVDVSSSNYLRLICDIGGSWEVLLTSDTACEINIWYHFAIARSGSDFYAFLGGNEVDGATNAGLISDSAQDLQIGHLLTEAAADRYFSGYMDELRISKGIARWTSNFTPPIGAYNGFRFGTKSVDTFEFGNKIDSTFIFGV